MVTGKGGNANALAFEGEGCMRQWERFLKIVQPSVKGFEGKIKAGPGKYLTVAFKHARQWPQQLIVFSNQLLLLGPALIEGKDRSEERRVGKEWRSRWGGER